MREEQRIALQRGLAGNCPHCGEHTFMKNWFQLHPTCPACGLQIETENGFTLATTSIAYVVSIIFVLLPVCVLIVLKSVSVLWGIVIAVTGSLLLSVAIYPLMLRLIVSCYYFFQTKE